MTCDFCGKPQDDRIPVWTGEGDDVHARWEHEDCWGYHLEARGYVEVQPGVWKKRETP